MSISARDIVEAIAEGAASAAMLVEKTRDAANMLTVDEVDSSTMAINAMVDALLKGSPRLGPGLTLLEPAKELQHQLSKYPANLSDVHGCAQQLMDAIAALPPGEL